MTSQWVGSLWVLVGACAIGAILIVLAQFSATSTERMRRFVLTAALVAWCGVSLGGMLVRPLTLLPSGRGVHGWSEFHYYLGPKYFPELGYTGLYHQALAADAQGAHRWHNIDRIRNLKTYRVEPVQDLVRSPRWTDERWRSFKLDLAFLEPYLLESDWPKVFRDRGYNAPPSSTALRRVLTRLDLSPRNLALVGALDTVLLLAAFVAVGRVFGPLRALVSLTWVALFFGNVGDRLIGQPFLYDYLSAMLFAACALKRGHSVLSGMLLAYAAVMRVFPALLLVGLVWWCVLHWRRTGRVSRRAVRFVLAFVATSAVLCAVGLGNGRGVDGWMEFMSNVSIHTDQHAVGSRRIGLAHLFIVDLSNPIGEQGTSDRLEAWSSRKASWQVFAAAVGVLWLWATARKRLDLFDTVFGALVLVFCAVVLSRYYWVVACLLMLTGGHAREGPMGGRGPAWIAAALFAWSGITYTYFLFQLGNLERYLFANLVATILVVGGLILVGSRRRGL